MPYTDIQFWQFILSIFAAVWMGIDIVDRLSRRYRGKSPKIQRDYRLPSLKILKIQRDYKIPSLKILKIERGKRSDRIWRNINIGLVIISFTLLTFDGYTFYLWITRAIPPNLDVISILFLSFITGFPIYTLRNVFIIDPRIRIRGYSRVAKSALLVVEEDTRKLFQICQHILSTMGAVTNYVDIKLKLIRADIGDKDEMAIKIKRTRGF